MSYGGGYGGRDGDGRDNYDSGRRDDGGAYDRRDDGRRDDNYGSGGYGGHGGREGNSRPDDRYSDRRDEHGGYGRDDRRDDYDRRDENRRDDYGRSSGGGGGYGGGQDYRPPQGSGIFHGADDDDDDFNGARKAAKRYAGKNDDDDDEETSLFSSALGMLSGKKKSGQIDHRIDEEEMIKAHKQTYDGGDGNADSNTVGAGAAMQALKMFSGGQAGGKNSQSDFVGLAMSEASKMMGGKPPQEKQSAINTAAEMALKMYLNGKTGGGGGGSSGGGGAGDLLSLASKFLSK